MLIRTLNIQYADCGMGFERQCQRKAGRPLLVFNRDAGRSLLFAAPPPPPAHFSPQLRLGNKQSCLIIKSRENKRRWSGGEEEREKGYKSCDLDVQYFGFMCLNLSCVKTFCA